MRFVSLSQRVRIIVISSSHKFTDAIVQFFIFSIAHFELEEYVQAKQAFEAGLKERQEKSSGSKDVTSFNRYIRKCEAEIAGKLSI